MKLALKSFVFAAISLFVISCSGGDDPTSSLKSFFEKISKKDIDGAAKFATKGSKTTLDLLKKGVEASEDEKSDPNDLKDLEYGKPTINGTTATISVTNKKDKSTVDFTMKKEDGAWKVDFTMETLMKMGKDAMETPEG
ncbi:MAG: hypothetical protein ACKO6Q_03675 [Bacteroidota bacterium]